jgi:hypothetical protein
MHLGLGSCCSLSLGTFASPTADLNAIGRIRPETFALDRGLLAARWATLKQKLGWDDRQCREAIVKHPHTTAATYGHQYVLDVAQCWIEQQIVTTCATLLGCSLCDAFMPTVCLYGSHYVTKQALMLTTVAITPRRDAAVRSGWDSTRGWGCQPTRCSPPIGAIMMLHHDVCFAGSWLWLVLARFCLFVWGRMSTAMV